MEETVRWPDCCREGGCRDFAFALRAAVGSLGTPVMVVLRFAESVSRLFPLFSEGARPSVGIALPFASRSISKLLVGSIPGPTLFLGARAAGFEGACAGKWLWRRDRMAMLVGGGGGMADVSELGAVEAPLGFLAVD